jgi:hypothetical protein
MKNQFLTGIALILFSSAIAQTSNNQSKKSIKMKEYILLNRVPLNYGGKEAKEVIETWNNVMGKYKADSIFVTSFVFPNEGYVISGSEKTVKKETVSANNLKIVSTIVIKAASYEEAIELAKAFPILQQGGTVEVSEIMSRPLQAK